MASRRTLSLARLFLAFAAGFPSLAHADPIISEFMAANSKTLADVDGAFSDWIEIYNPDSTAANLEGWFLTDTAKTKNKWKFPAVTLPAGGFLVVFASNKNRTDATAQLHTNFALDAGGGYLGLIKPDGTTAASEFAPAYPKQSDDISYGVTQPTLAGEAAKTGFFKVATPGARNGGADALVLTDAVTFSRASGPFASTVPLTLSGAAGTQRIRYVIAAPSTSGGTVADPGPTSTLYTGAISLTTSVIVRAAIFSADDKEHGPVTSGHFVHLSSSGAARLDTFSSELPVLVVDTHGFGQMLKDNIDRPAWAYLWNRPSGATTSLTAAPSLGSAATTRLHGSSSSDFPKKSYNLDLKDLLGGANPQAMLGVDAFDGWVLTGPWKYDATFIHNAFIYSLSNQIGRWAPRTRFVEVFFNADGGDLDANDYVGVYVLTDKLEVDPKRVAITTLDKTDTGSTKITGGYFLKLDVPDNTVYSFRTTHGVPSAPSAVYVDSPKLADLATAQRDYIKGYIQGLDDALFSGEANAWPTRAYANYLDRPSFVDHHILNTFAANTDAFWRSTYMTKDRSERLVAGPVWDFDRALGGGDVRTQNPLIWNGADGATDLWNFGWWGPLRHDPEFMQEWVDRWQQLRQSTFSTATLKALVDTLAAQIGPAAAGRDYARWTAADNLQRFPTGWQGEIDQLKNWLAQRASWIDSQFTTAPAVTTAGSTIVITPAAGTVVAYTTDGTDPRLLGGAVSAAAVVSATPVTLPATTNLHARGYVTDFNSGSNPGSPWSSIATGPNSTSTLPRPFLSNLSVLTSLADSESFTMGFIVGGDGTGGPKPLLVRAGGPSLAQFGVPSPHPDPQLAFYNGVTKIDENNNWGGGASLRGVFESVGAFPFVATSSKDAAVYNPAVPAGSNSVLLSGVGSTAGAVLAELYDASSTLTPSSPRLVNVSVLKHLGDGLTVGFIVAPVGGPAKRLLVRVIGPTLGGAPYNVPNVVADPQLSLYRGPNLLSENNDWGGTTALREAFQTAGAFALSDTSRDAAIVASLAPGSYTVVAKGVNGTTGQALVEVYELP